MFAFAASSLLAFTVDAALVFRLTALTGHLVAAAVAARLGGPGGGIRFPARRAG